MRGVGSDPALPSTHRLRRGRPPLWPRYRVLCLCAARLPLSSGVAAHRGAARAAGRDRGVRVPARGAPTADQNRRGDRALVTGLAAAGPVPTDEGPPFRPGRGPLPAAGLGIPSWWLSTRLLPPPPRPRPQLRRHPRPPARVVVPYRPLPARPGG